MNFQLAGAEYYSNDKNESLLYESLSKTTTTTTTSDSLLFSLSLSSPTPSIGISSSPETYEDYFDPRFPRWLALVLLVVGLFGNSLSLIVFTRDINMRRNSTFIYLAFLCVVDLFVLVLGLGDIVLISYYKFILRNKSFFMCRLHTFLTYSFTHLSSFILASVSIDRAIATNLINFAKIYCKPNMALKIIAINCLLAVLINFHTLLFLGFKDNDDVSPSTTSPSSTDILALHANSNNTPTTHSNYANSFHCASKDGTIYDKFLDPYFEWIDLIFYAFLPFITMAVCTYLIIRVLVISNKRLNKGISRNASALLSNKANNNITTTTPILANNNTNNNPNSNTTSNENETEKQQQPQPQPQQQQQLHSNRRSLRSVDKRANNRVNKTIHLTYTLVSINALFFCLVSPLVIVNIMMKGKQSILQNKILINIVYLLAYSNHSFNFIFYGLSSPPYRNAVKRLFGCHKDSRSLSKNKTNFTTII
jgi:hypothetical protein